MRKKRTIEDVGGLSPIEYLIERKYPRLTLYDVYSGEENKPHDRTREIEKYRQLLRKMPPAELKKLYEAEQEQARQEGELTPDMVESLFHFNQADEIDFSYWCKLPLWTIEEAVALSFGKNPEKVNWDSIKEHKKHSRFVANYEQVRQLALRTRMSGEQLTDPLPPLQFIDWAETHEISFPEEIEKKVKTWQNKKKKDAKAKKIKNFEGSPINPKVLESLSKMLLGMAMDKYGYDPRAARTSTSALISENLKKKGICIDADTIRTRLKEATDIVVIQYDN